MLPDQLLQSCALLFVLVVFGQSGLDKLLNYRDNRDYFNQQFSKSPLANFAGLLLPVIALMEVASAALALIGLFMLWTSGTRLPGLFAMALSCLTFIALIFGQRLAKDYGGAAGIVPYLGVTMLGLYVFS
jgi:uncharacterized membrane protein YphA (DoxX/SURF4 family)